MLKQILKNIIVFIITFEAKLALKKYKPKIVAITGTVGKTSAKDAIARVLEKKFSVRKTTKSYNSEVGVPLVVLGCENAWLNPFLWLVNIAKGLKVIIYDDYPEWLVLELGIERPKDMEKLMAWIKPNIAVITALSDIPPHVEYFPGPNELIEEKAKILKGLKRGDFAILNKDDGAVFALKNDDAKTGFITFGFDGEADIMASNYKIVLREEDARIVPEGITFKVDHKGNSVPVRLFNTFGKHQVYSALSGMAVGIAAGLNMVEISEALAVYAAPPGRLKLIEGEKDTFILDDTYNASPVAMRAALEVLYDIPAQRKIAVLGDMLELGKYAIEAHKAMGEEVSRFVDVFFAVGPRAKFIVEALKEKGFPKENIFVFSTSEEAAEVLEKNIESGDLILVKGSQAMRMEKIVEEIMAHPEKKEELLVRQDKAWKNKK